jgi:hypothetical protein
MMRGKPFYKVHWKGYPSYDDSWEPLSNLTHCQEAIDEYRSANPTHPFSISLCFSSSSSSPHVILAISPENASNIRSGIKDHEFRKYRLPPDARFLWLYETAPLHGISTIIEVDSLRLPGQVTGSGLGSADFNAGYKASRFAYPILRVLRLPSILSSTELLNRHSVTPPHRWCPAPSSLPLRFDKLFPLIDWGSQS